MAVKSKASEALRKQYLTTISTFLEKEGEQVLLTKSNEIAIPCVNSEGDDEFVVISFKVPTGSRDGDIYDGYAEAESYALNVKLKAEKAAEAAKRKAEKIARDTAERAKKAKAKAERVAKAEN